MKNLKKIVNSDAAYEILDRSNCGGSTWTEGGCAILAQALNMLGDYPMYVIYNKKIDSSEHFGVMTPSGTILDGDGEHSSADAWLKFFRENEMPIAGELVVIPFDSNVDMEGINFDKSASSELAEFIKNHQMIRESIRKVLSESIIKENIGQAEKVLNMNSVSLDDPDYLDFKKKLNQNNNIGYLGFIVKLSTNNRFQKVLANDIYDLIIANKNILNKLPKPLMNYDDFSTLRKDLKNSTALQLINKLSNKLTNENIKNELVNYVNDIDFIGNIEFFLKASSSDRQEFMSKTDKYKTAQEFVDDFSNFVDELRIGFKYDIVLSKVSSMNESEINVLLADKSKQMILARILKYTASREIGSKSWCIVGNEHQFNEYTKDGENYQYFFFNFNPDTPANEKMIAFTMDKDNQVTACHDRYDSVFNEPVAYLSKLGIMPKIYEINSRERKKFELNSLGQPPVDGENNDGRWKYILRTYERKRVDYSGKEVIEIEKPKEYKDGLRFVSDVFLNYLTRTKNNLDIIIKKFENYPVNVYSYINKTSHQETVNIVQIVLGDIDNLLKYSEPNRESLIDIMQKVYLSNFTINKETKIAIMHFLKDNGVDILKLSQQMKSKAGQSLSDMEFAMLNKRGEDLKPNIQNKLAAIRRGEDVSMNVAEIGYAIDNGFANVIKKYYQSMITDFANNQLGYEDMQVYQKLGMFDQVEKVLTQKANIYGDDVLNSIEKSIVDISRRKAALSEVRNLVRENVISALKEASAEKVWYHGTPDVRDLEKEGGFTQRYLNIEYVDDIEGYEKVQDELSLARESGDEDRYFKILDTVKNFRKKAKIRKPIFLTDTHSIARTYADPQRAFDYQNSVEKVLKVRLKDGNGVTINASGDRFRFIDTDKVKRGFINAGVDEKEFDLIVRKLNYAVSVKKGIKTDNVAAIGDWFGFDYIDVVGVLDSYNGGNTKSTVRMVFNPSDIEIIKESNNLREFEEYIDSVFNILKESDEPSPTFEWDVAKEKIDNSKRGVKTREQAYEYLVRLLDKIKNLPKAIKIRITKYVAMSFMMLLGAGVINGLVSEKTPEISHEIAVVVDNVSKSLKKKVVEAPRKSSVSLVKILKHEEGSIRHKGEPVLKAYKLGDGMITVGWGHAERTNNSQFRPGQKITRQQAEELLSADIAEAERGLNIILNDWEEQGIELKITQPMYDAMISMIFNMGIGNFRKSDFIQLVKDGDYEMAAERILTTNVSYPGHVPRRQKESELFSKGLESNDISEVRNIIRAVLKEEVIEETQTGQKDLEGFANDILQFLGKLIVKEKKHMEFLTSGLENESSDITYFPTFATGTMTGEKYKEISDFVSETSIKIIPTQGLPKGTSGDMGYAPPGPSGREIFEIRLKHSNKDVEDINKLFKDQENVESGDVYFRLYYMFYTVLLHELQHAYDAWRSKGKAFAGAVNKDFIKRREDAKRTAMSKQAYELTPEEMEAIQNSFKEYQNLVHEINARYAQAMHSVRMTGVDYNTFNKVMHPWEDVYKSFAVEFDGWRNLSDKMKRKLTRRVAKAYSETADIVAADNK